MNNILSKIEEAGLVGRGGAGFPAHLKWQAVKQAKLSPKYVICNASEGELAVCKDFYILENFPETVIRGMIIAMDFLGTKYAYFNFNKNYYEAVHRRINIIIKKYEKEGYVFRIFKEKPSYIGGEETALLNAIEGKRVEPRAKPPYPSEEGLFSQPTLIHNVETLYNIARVYDGSFEDTRFYAISGKVKNPGVYEYPVNYSIEKVLRESNNYPKSAFFVQVGGSASGPVYHQGQIMRKRAGGAGAIEVYPMSIKPREVLLRWFEFYKNESCGKCTPCREGSYQLWNLVKNSKKIPWDDILPIIDTMEKTAFCALGTSVAVPVKTYLKNVYPKQK